VFVKIPKASDISLRILQVTEIGGIKVKDSATFYSIYIYKGEEGTSIIEMNCLYLDI
jgi:hypothetical protein